MAKGKLGHESNRRGGKDQNSAGYIRYDLKQAVVAGDSGQEGSKEEKAESKVRRRGTLTVETACKDPGRKGAISYLQRLWKN